MLELKHIRKIYKIGDIETRALDDINVAFRDKEFVAILGKSGSGKTTCLNIIGGLDRYDSGEMLIKGKNTKNFKEKDWDAYRNNSIGFVFQSYNLISHVSIVANVELSMTLSGVSSGEKRKRAIEALKSVGLEDHLHKKPNQLSGGQMQRVAIARALVNNPEILLCDEPTGALDSATSVQIMDLIKEIAKERLVIMVTHNPELAEEYADRIIQFQDGNIISDSHSHEERPKEDQFKLVKTSMSFFTALKLSANNIWTKKGRTFLTGFASSIGIIGIAIIISLSSGFQIQIDKFQKEALAQFPITVSPVAANINPETIKEQQAEDEAEPITAKEAYLYDPAAGALTHTNNISNEFVDYLNKIDPAICSNIGYTRTVNMNLVREINGVATPVMITSGTAALASGDITSPQEVGVSSYPTQIDGNESSAFLEQNYDLLSGAYPTSATDIILVVDSKNRVNFKVMKALGFDAESGESIQFDEIVGTEIKVIDNDDYYVKTPIGTYAPGTDYEAMYNSQESITLNIAGVVRVKPDSQLNILSPGLAYRDDLSTMVINNAMDSEIVTAQNASNLNILTNNPLKEGEKEHVMSYLGGNSTPSYVMIYPTSFENKDAVTAYLDDFNKTQPDENKIVYTDMAKIITDMTSSIMYGITIVLIAFAAISLIVSLIMIAIITYTSVLERTKEIGILKALGARKKDITRVFDAETCLLGLFSGTLGIIIAYICTIPINMIIYNITELENVAQLNIVTALILLAISTLLTVIGGHIPARIASKKDAVEALRSE